MDEGLNAWKNRRFLKELGKCATTVTIRDATVLPILQYCRDKNALMLWWTHDGLNRSSSCGKSIGKWELQLTSVHARP